MPNRSHFNPALRTMNRLRRDGINHSSSVEFKTPEKTLHALFTEDSIKFLKKLPDSSVQLVLIDPPYNIDLAHWDNFSNYLDWAKQWLNEIDRILTDNGNFVIFGGFQYQNEKKGDLLEIMHYLRHSTKLNFVNLVIWYYKTGMSAHRFFANRHEEALWFAKTKKYDCPKCYAISFKQSNCSRFVIIRKICKRKSLRKSKTVCPAVCF